jgi:hypothetical protein
MTDAPDEAPVRPFADWLRELQRGKVHDEMSVALRDLVNKCKETGKGGTISIAFKLTPAKGDGDMLLVTDDIKVSAPKPERKPSYFWADDNGNLSRDNPNQLSFDSLTVVPPTADLQPQAGEAQARSN